MLVTGATGNLGRAVVRRLGEEGHLVSVLTRRPFLAAAHFGGGVGIHEWHPRSEAVPPEAVEHTDAVMHLMGAPLCGDRSREVAAELVSSRTNSTRRLVEALRGRGGRLVVASVAVAPGEAGPPVTEGASSDAIVSSLERDILSWEAEAAAGAADGMSVAVVRLGLIAMPSRPLATLVALAKRGLCPNLKGAMIPAIAPDDAVAMLSGLLQHRSLEGVIHGVAPEPVAGEVLMRALRRYAPGGRALTVPLSVLKRRLGLAAAMLSCHRRIVPQRLEMAGAAYFSPDPMSELERALEDTGQSPDGARLTRAFGRRKTRRAAEPEPS